MDIDLDVERNAVRKYYAAWISERDARDSLVAECSATRRTPPGDYWKAERAARLRFYTAELLLAALEDVTQQ